jgi:hypothetical protein
MARIRSIYWPALATDGCAPAHHSLARRTEGYTQLCVYRLLPENYVNGTYTFIIKLVIRRDMLHRLNDVAWSGMRTSNYTFWPFIVFIFNEVTNTWNTAKYISKRRSILTSIQAALKATKKQMGQFLNYRTVVIGVWSTNLSVVHR